MHTVFVLDTSIIWSEPCISIGPALMRELMSPLRPLGGNIIALCQDEDDEAEFLFAVLSFEDRVLSTLSRES